eukprot:symbB.v1.2.038153.t1/scaffold5847.1/size23122/2
MEPREIRSVGVKNLRRHQPRGRGDENSPVDFGIIALVFFLGLGWILFATRGAGDEDPLLPIHQAQDGTPKSQATGVLPCIMPVTKIHQLTMGLLHWHWLGWILFATVQLNRLPADRLLKVHQALQELQDAGLSEVLDLSQLLKVETVVEITVDEEEEELIPDEWATENNLFGNLLSLAHSISSS